ncbi:MAG TPA: hypothetical protein EYH02_03605 [Ignisphaera aggregans]|uniref:Uncharacterized protein n=1 Tax=Ignisphaera aggregans TaxID=334771 RepID=A0A833DUF6_9CREN|nr:hypothetical protein [Ignisphaera aggregans]
MEIEAEASVSEKTVVEQGYREPIEADIELVSEVAQVAKVLESTEKHLEEVKRDVDSVRHSVESAMKRIGIVYKLSEWIGSWKCCRCKFNEKGVCKAWKLADSAVEELKRELGEECLVVVDGVTRFRVDRVPLLGALCPLFRPRT